jgi:protocatechuate 3,4-dioxygenase beta subunit
MSCVTPSPEERFFVDRRGFLQVGGLTLLGFAGVACADGSSSPANTTVSPATSPTAVDTSVASSVSAATQATTLNAAAFDGLGTCVLLPEATAGPFPLDEQFERRDVTEGSSGHPLRLGLRVVDSSCQPVAGAKVEIWHADASGDYSAFADGGGGKDDGPGTTFLRGTQPADQSGIVEFLTIYPGWYRGRAVHIHLRVHVADTTVLTSQLYFDGDYTAGVYAAAPYAEFGLPDTTNGSDDLAGKPVADGTLLHTSPTDTPNGPGTLGLLNLGIDLSG